MTGTNKNNDNFIPTILFIVLASIVLLFANNEKRNITNYTPSSIASIIEVKVYTKAVIPGSLNLPPCTSFVDTKHIILDFSEIRDYLLNLQISNQFKSLLEKHISIRPILIKLLQQSHFHVSNDADLPSFS
jgi:hypothetical protein